MFPVLKNISSVMDSIAGRKEFRIIDLDDGTSVICYMIAEKDSFGDPLRRECRGITFDKETGEIILRPYHKFFNVFEKEETQASNLNKLALSHITAKLDGSMVIVGLHNDKLICHYKKSVCSIKNLLNEQLCMTILKQVEKLYGKCTFLFERLYKTLTKDHQHVLSYRCDELVLLDVRVNETGEYLSPKEVLRIGNSLNISAVHVIHDLGTGEAPVLADILSLAANERNIEGWVASYANGIKVKVKTLWYANIHHLIDVLSERHVARLVISERIDDAKAALWFRLSEDQKVWLLEMEDRIAKDFHEYKESFYKLAEEAKDLNMRQVAKTYGKGDIYRINLMRKANEPDWQTMFTKEVLMNKYSTKSIFGFDK